MPYMIAGVTGYGYDDGPFQGRLPKWSARNQCGSPTAKPPVRSFLHCNVAFDPSVPPRDVARSRSSKLRPHPEERREAMRLEGWQHRDSPPSFETLATQAPQDEVRRFSYSTRSRRRRGRDPAGARRRVCATSADIPCAASAGISQIRIRADAPGMTAIIREDLPLHERLLDDEMAGLAVAAFEKAARLEHQPSALPACRGCRTS